MENMLYPQYQHKFEKTIGKGLFKHLQEKAEELLAKNGDHAHLDVVNHWKSVANGEVPFGYELKEDE